MMMCLTPIIINYVFDGQFDILLNSKYDIVYDAKYDILLNAQ